MESLIILAKNRFSAKAAVQTQSSLQGAWVGPQFFDLDLHAIFFHFQNKQKNFAAYNEMTISENILLKSVDNLIRLVIRTIFLNAVLTFLFSQCICL
jgi:uncharacterized membrane protein